MLKRLRQGSCSSSGKEGAFKAGLETTEKPLPPLVSGPAQKHPPGEVRICPGNAGTWFSGPQRLLPQYSGSSFPLAHHPLLLSTFCIHSLGAMAPGEVGTAVPTSQMRRLRHRTVRFWFKAPWLLERRLAFGSWPNSKTHNPMSRWGRKPRLGLSAGEPLLAAFHPRFPQPEDTTQ